MDIYCPNCGEPWELDTLHEEVKERHPGSVYVEKTYAKWFSEVRSDFAARGCDALGNIGARPCSGRKVLGAAKTRAAVSSALLDAFGDDIDGVCAELQDAEYLGLI